MKFSRKNDYSKSHSNDNIFITLIKKTDDSTKKDNYF
ncbi:hypothetical protein CZ809_00695 [Photobacterium piscicola]|uniref:Uncharacterized protein n=1 Tax=Photobacterium piscicola TaxID=1378299 RepID=A0A1T5HWI3_9GAMM|nr:hypothetical protein CZ809_00695 [Photobacterium piscicola]